jgi:hypothetical protein
MKTNQLTRGAKRRVMYVENKAGNIDGAVARIGWVSFSQTGLSVHYRGRTLKRSKGTGIRGNYYDEATGEEYWISGVKVRGSNTHRAESVRIEVDEDARDEYQRLRSRTAG